MSLPVIGGGAPDVLRHAGQVLGRTGQAAASLYIHVPFCFHKCHYCDFYSLVDTQDRQEAFASRLIEELTAVEPWIARPVETVFIGGGTPTLLRPDLWKRLLETLDRVAGTRLLPARGGEFTVECNPETASEELMTVLSGGGVTRISIGAQSFRPEHLKTLERWHDPANVARAINLARSAGIGRQSLDLIFGIPGQTLRQWQEDLGTGIDLGTEHLSCYGLTYEQGTAMTARLARAEFTKIDEDLEADMFDATVTTLRGAGLERYEVSNFARPGAECRHNLAYWRQRNWLALGPSASGHIAGWRWKNAPRLDDYLRLGVGGFSPVCDVEEPNPRRGLLELVMTSMRLREGVDEDRVLASAGTIDAAIASRWERAVGGLLAAGQIERRDGRIIPTDAGFPLTNRVVGALAGAIDP